MPVDVIKATNGSFYIPMDGAWNSKEDDEAYIKSFALFNALKESKDYVALIKSHHWATHGYWVELSEGNIIYPDLLLKEHKRIIEKPDH